MIGKYTSSWKTWPQKTFFSFLNTLIRFHLHWTFACCQQHLPHSNTMYILSSSLDKFCCKYYCDYKKIKIHILQAYNTAVCFSICGSCNSNFWKNYKYFSSSPCKTTTFQTANWSGERPTYKPESWRSHLLAVWLWAGSYPQWIVQHYPRFLCILGNNNTTFSGGYKAHGITF